MLLWGELYLLPQRSRGNLECRKAVFSAAFPLLQVRTLCFRTHLPLPGLVEKGGMWHLMESKLFCQTAPSSEKRTLKSLDKNKTTTTKNTHIIPIGSKHHYLQEFCLLWPNTYSNYTGLSLLSWMYFCSYSKHTVSGLPPRKKKKKKRNTAVGNWESVQDYPSVCSSCGIWEGYASLSQFKSSKESYSVFALP